MPHNSKLCQCPYCETWTLTLIGEDPPRVGLWRCSNCGELKRWCPLCDQGWIVHGVLARSGRDLYACEECDATWWSVASIPEGEGGSLEPLAESLGEVEPWQSTRWVRDFG
jgi:ribosomal protein L37AE/L43A